MKLALAAACLAALVGAGRAQACSFAPPDAAAYLDRYDGAFIGALVEKREPKRGAVHSSADPAVYVFRVESVAKGEVPATVEVVSAIEGASCGLETPVGQRTGLFLVRDGDTWRSSLPLQVAPAQLEQAVADANLLLRAPLPASGAEDDGSGPVPFVAAVVTAFGGAALAVFLVRRRRPGPTAA